MNAKIILGSKEWELGQNALNNINAHKQTKFELVSFGIISSTKFELEATSYDLETTWFATFTSEGMLIYLSEHVGECWGAKDKYLHTYANEYMRLVRIILTTLNKQ